MRPKLIPNLGQLLESKMLLLWYQRPLGRGSNQVRRQDTTICSYQRNPCSSDGVMSVHRSFRADRSSTFVINCMTQRDADRIHHSNDSRQWPWGKKCCTEICD